MSNSFSITTRDLYFIINALAELESRIDETDCEAILGMSKQDLCEKIEYFESRKK